MKLEVQPRTALVRAHPNPDPNPNANPNPNPNLDPKQVEPGTFLVANSGALVTSVQDLVTTGEVPLPLTHARTRTRTRNRNRTRSPTPTLTLNPTPTPDRNPNLVPAQGGFSFLKLDSGMTELLRPSLYG